TKTEVYSLVSPTSDKIYVYGQLDLKSQFANRLHQNRGRYSTRAQSQPINHLYENRGRFSTGTKG
ncbi:MAG: hypothetical protein ACKPKO_05165, partial [Candidatus Fonsibacter sp.]